MPEQETYLEQCAERISESLESGDWCCGRYPQEAVDALALWDTNDLDPTLDLIQMLSDKIGRLRTIIARCVEANETGDYYNDDVWREAAEAARET